MTGYKINPDEKHVDSIIKGLKAKEGYCPCKVQKVEGNLCPCDEFITTGECHCKLWVKK